MKSDIEETLTMVTSLITPRLNDQYDNMVTLQNQSDQKLKTVMDLKSSLTKANDKYDFYLSPSERNRSSVYDKTQYFTRGGGGELIIHTGSITYLLKT